MPVVHSIPERFVNLPDFPHAARFVELNGLKIHYVDEGKGETILCLHGEPSWAFLYRKMIPRFVGAGKRVVAPDFIGFGRSDKFTGIEDYSFKLHFQTIESFIERLDLREITLVCQDWGGLIGLTVAAQHPERFSRLVIMNTGLPTGEEKMPDGFMAWRAFALRTPDLVASMVVRKACATGKDLPADVLAAYDAPFPNLQHKAGMHAFPRLVPISTDMAGAAEMKEARRRLSTWTKPVQMTKAKKSRSTPWILSTEHRSHENKSDTTIAKIEGVWDFHGSFPLTPALSLGERENRSQTLA